MSNVLAPLSRRFLALFYEVLALSAFVWAAGFVYSAAEQIAGIVHVRIAFQAYLAVAIGIYFVAQWLHGGQTLAMRTWRLKVVPIDGGPLHFRQALVRYVVALVGTIALGATFLWAFVDRERCFLHDRVARTRIVRL